MEIFGPGKLNELHTEQPSGKKALIVTTNGQSVIKYGYLDRVKKELDLAGIEYTVLPEYVRTLPTSTSWTAQKYAAIQEAKYEEIKQQYAHAGLSVCSISANASKI